MIKKLLYISLYLISFLNSGFVNPETGWEYEQSTFQAFYIFENLNVDGSISTGDGCVPNDDCDQSSCYCCSSCTVENFIADIYFLTEKKTLSEH